jgi:LysM repeat protein
MVLEHDESRTHELAGLVRGAAVVVAVGAGVVLLLALIAEALRRRGRARRVVHLLDHIVPGRARAVAVSVLALLATVVPARPIVADDSVRGWLGRPAASAAPPPVVTPEAVDELVPTTLVPSDPMVLIPDGDPGAAPPTTPSTAAAPPPDPPVGPPPAAPAAPTYVVQPGDCLWSIAARRLGPDPDPTAIDAGWRAIYLVNRATVGDDPGLIHPGLVLRLPPVAPPP